MSCLIFSCTEFSSGQNESAFCQKFGNNFHFPILHKLKKVEMYTYILQNLAKKCQFAHENSDFILYSGLAFKRTL